jgi:tetratricopeptide (TPR) repeat protein
MYLRAVANFLEGHADEAIADCNVLLNLAPNADVFWIRANAYNKKGDKERAAKDLAEARRLAIIHPLDGDPKEGKRLAVELCSSCHDTGETSNRKKKYKAPSFQTIASRPSQSADQIVADIIYPHPGMPRLRFESFFDAMQFSSLAAYVMTLKKSSN